MSDIHRAALVEGPSHLLILPFSHSSARVQYDNSWFRAKDRDLEVKKTRSLFLSMRSQMNNLLSSFFGGRGVGWDWDLKSGFHVCKAGTLPLKSHLQSIFALVILEMRSHMDYCPRWS
jgi:hypothetical protein